MLGAARRGLALHPAVVAAEAQGHVGVADRADTRGAITSMQSAAWEPESTYSQTGSRGLAW